MERTPSSEQTVESATARPTRDPLRRRSARRRPPASTARSVLLSSRLVAIATRSLASVVRASFQPSSSSPTRQSSGTNTSSRNTSLNSASPVISRSGRTSMPGALHVDQEVADALVLRGVRVGAGQADAPVGALGDRGPHLLAGEPPAAVDLLGAGAQRGQVGAGAGLGEQLAPHQLAEQRRPHEPLALLVGAVLEDRRQRPAGDHDVRAGSRRRAASSWSMTIWVTGVRAEAVRRGPVRGEVAGLDQRRAPLVRRQAGDRSATVARTPSRIGSSRPSRSTSTRRRTPATAAAVQPLGRGVAVTEQRRAARAPGAGRGGRRARR